MAKTQKVDLAFIKANFGLGRNTQTKEASEQEFMDTFARTFLAWQNVEAQLFLLFNTLVRTQDHNLTSAVFHSVVSLEVRLAMVSAAIQIALARKSALLKKWETVKNKIENRYRNRNTLAHFSLSGHTSGRGKFSLRLRPSIFNVRASKQDYDCRQLKEFGITFTQLATDLRAFTDDLLRVVPQCPSPKRSA